MDSTIAMDDTTPNLTKVDGLEPFIKGDRKNCSSPSFFSLLRVVAIVQRLSVASVCLTMSLVVWRWWW